MPNRQAEAQVPHNPPAGSSYAPTRKVGAGALAGALSIILVWALNSFAFTDPNGMKITGEIASALTTIMTFVTGYFVPESA